MLAFEFDEVSLVLQHSRPAYEPKTQTPPTHRTIQPEDDHM